MKSLSSEVLCNVLSLCSSAIDVSAIKISNLLGKEKTPDKSIIYLGFKLAPPAGLEPATQ